MVESLDKNKLYYLASPYSHKDKNVIETRYDQVNEAGAILCINGFNVIEPIAMCHHKAKLYKLPGTYDYWQTKNKKFISVCDSLIVLTIDGWKESVGVTDEIKYAISLGKEVHYFELEYLRTCIGDT